MAVATETNANGLVSGIPEHGSSPECDLRAWRWLLLVVLCYTPDVGIVIGAGTDVAIETADIILVRDDPRDVAAVVRLSRATYHKMLQNLAWATGYNVVAIPLAAGVLAGVGFIMSPAVGAVLMSLSTIIVAINARLLKAPQT